MWKSKYDMEVGKGQQFGFSCFKPSLSGNLLTFWTVSVTAGMIHDTLSAAVVTALNVAATICGAAVNDVGYDPVLIRPQGICVSIVYDMLAKNISHL